MPCKNTIHIYSISLSESRFLDIISDSTPLSANIMILSFFVAIYNSIASMCHNFLTLISLLVDGRLSWFHDLAVVNRAAIGTDAQVSLWYVDNDFFECISESSVAGSQGSSVFGF